MGTWWECGGSSNSTNWRIDVEKARYGKDQCSATKQPAAEFAGPLLRMDLCWLGFQLRRLSRLRHPAGLRTSKKFLVSGCQRPERVAAESGMKHNPA
ncbi:hypothetical protein RE6C_05853 [Rhodopirellula europaea 6C]|uniref:Uncharacterized protein n=1 Tax=Rhodopirellula europaea 6C TaxID=1263867 RepID=M2AL46_9BACT|nr:hypothetical protein RE6C_05853 [Rhodopirellula europaea 6C]